MKVPWSSTTSPPASFEAMVLVLLRALRRHTRHATLPRVVMAGSDRGGGWVGDVDELEALQAAGPGRIEARLHEAVWNLGLAARRGRGAAG